VAAGASADVARRLNPASAAGEPRQQILYNYLAQLQSRTHL
jgi:hypothetical protein